MIVPVIATLIQSPNHQAQGHPENPARFQFIQKQIALHLSKHIRWIESTHAHTNNLQLVHPEGYIQNIQYQASMGPRFVDYGDTYITQSSFEDSLNAVGGVLSILNLVLSGRLQRGFAIIRPPGHHASAERAMGFCLFNNIAIAARQAQESGFKRLAIVDFDVHHGNGTQDIFYADGDVLYISTHQWGIFPGTGAKTELGIGDGLGSTLNIPLPPGVGDAGFDSIFSAIIIPALQRFKPELLLVSAGFDAHYADPLANLQLSGEGYFNITRKLAVAADELCDGRLLMVLEGGYNPEALAHSVRCSCQALTGMDRCQEASDVILSPEPNIEALIAELKGIHDL